MPTVKLPARIRRRLAWAMASSGRFPIAGEGDAVGAVGRAAIHVFRQSPIRMDDRRPPVSLLSLTTGCQKGGQNP